jgi:hypothetical protein
MTDVKKILSELRHQVEWSQPNMRYNETMRLINHLEDILFPKPTQIVKETPVVEEIPVMEEILITEEISSEIDTTKEPEVTDTTVVKKRGSKKAE